MKQAKLYLIGLAAVVAFSAFKCGDGGGVYDGRLPMDNRAVTEKGVLVYSNGDITEAAKQSIDAGLDRLFAIAESKPYSYTGFSRHAGYTVFLLPRSNKCQAAGFLVDATGSPYEGSSYDKDPSPNRCLICANGMMQLVNLRPGMILVDDAGTLSNAARFEGEHNLLFEVDLAKFQQTQYHADGTGHPILPDITGNLADDVLRTHQLRLKSSDCVLLSDSNF